MSTIDIQIFSIIISFVALLFAAYMFHWVKKQPSENETIKKISNIFFTSFTHLYIKTPKRFSVIFTPL